MHWQMMSRKGAKKTKEIKKKRLIGWRLRAGISH
jgi:hypothetical protein